MKLGTQISDNLSGSKYPFAEDSESVSAYTVAQKQERGKLPCDLFSDVVVDADFGEGESFVVWAVHGEEGIIDFARWDSTKAENNESYIPEILFSASKPDFDNFGRLLYVSNDVFARIETRHRDDFDDVVKYTASVLVQGDPEDPGDEDQILPSVLYGPIHFDSRCTRKPEKRLQAFAVHGSIVQGDVKFMPGYNVAIEQPILGADNSLSIRAEAGAGEGRVPCDEAYVGGNSSGIAGLTPGVDGDIRIETDGCYSIAPMSERMLKIMGHCRSCCSCEGDYLPAANATNYLISRLDSAYEALTQINENYSNLIKDTIEKTGADEAGQPELFVSATRTDASAESDHFRTKIDISFMNTTPDDLQVLSIWVRSSVVLLADFSDSSDFVPEMDRAEIESRLASGSVVETLRSLQIGTDVLSNEGAIIPGLLVFPSGEAIYATTSSQALRAPGSKGYALYNSPSVKVDISYRKGADGDTKTASRTVAFR